MNTLSTTKGNGYIGQLANVSGVPIKTIRYYEEVGLLQKSQRTEGGYRIFSLQTVERLTFIKKAQHLGLSLEEIQDILDLSDRGRCPCGHVEKLLTHHLQDLHHRIQDLKIIEARIRQMLRTPCPPEACQPHGKARCPYIESVPVKFQGKNPTGFKEVRKSWNPSRK